MMNVCEDCIYYKPKNKTIGFCKKLIKIVKSIYIKECFESTHEEINKLKSNKITIINGKKIYS